MGFNLGRGGHLLVGGKRGGRKKKFQTFLVKRAFVILIFYVFVSDNCYVVVKFLK